MINTFVLLTTIYILLRRKISEDVILSLSCFLRRLMLLQSTVKHMLVKYLLFLILLKLQNILSRILNLVLCVPFNYFNSQCVLQVAPLHLCIIIKLSEISGLLASFTYRFHDNMIALSSGLQYFLFVYLLTFALMQVILCRQ